MSESKEIIENFLVAKIIDDYTIVINKGRNQGVKEGQRFLIYELGEEIIDPTSKNTLGKLEIVKGTGKVAHLQENIATISSDMKAPPLRTIKRIKSGSAYDSLFGFKNLLEPSEIEEQLPAEKVAFDNPKVGDFARQV